MLLTFGADVSQQSLFQVHRETVFAQVVMHRYWQAIMTSFAKELLGSYGFSLIPPDGLHAIIFANPQLLLPTKSMVAYARN